MHTCLYFIDVTSRTALLIQVDIHFMILHLFPGIHVIRLFPSAFHFHFLFSNHDVKSSH